MMSRKMLMTALLGSCAVAAPELAWAAEPPAAAESASSSDEIVVTARKREERLQEVPVSVTAFTGEKLERQGVTSFEGLALNNPNVKIAQLAGQAVSFGVAIRGNLQNNTTLTLDPSVGIYIDGVLAAHPFGTAGFTTDVASVQTLKGPQGTLFGRNTTGGAMLIATVDPKLGEMGGYVQADVGTVDTRRFGGAINIPIGDKLAMRLVYQNNARGDYQFFNNGVRLGRSEEYILRGKLLAEPTDSLRVVLTAEKSRQVVNSTMDTGTQPNAPRYDNVPVVTYVSPSSLAPGQSPIDPRANNERQGVVSEFYSLRAEQQLGVGNLKLLVGHHAYSLDIGQTLPPSLGYTRQDKPGNRDVSAELQFNGTLMDGKLAVASGVFYFKETIHERANTFLYSGSQRTSRLTDLESESISGYVQGSYKLTDQLGLTGGLRYTHDSKSSVLYSSTVGVDGNPQGTAAAALANPPATASISGSKVNYLVSIDYKPVQDVMFYASHASGYRAGGFGVDRVGAAPTSAGYRTIASYLPESLKNYEVGFKTQLFDRRLTFNGAAFYQDYKNYQYSGIDPVTVQRVTLNTDARIKGFELDSSLRLATGTTLSANMGLTDAKLQSGPAKGSHLAHIPRVNWSVSADQKIDLAGGNLDLFASYSWQGKYWTTVNDPLAAGDEEAASMIKARGMLNASATFTTGPWQIAVYGTNLTDTRYYTYRTVSGAAINFSALGVPRVIGARAKYTF